MEVGDVVDFKAPNGDKEYEIISIETMDVSRLNKKKTLKGSFL